MGDDIDVIEILENWWIAVVSSIVTIIIIYIACCVCYRTGCIDIMIVIACCECLSPEFWRRRGRNRRERARNDAMGVTQQQQQQQQDGVTLTAFAVPVARPVATTGELV